MFEKICSWSNRMENFWAIISTPFFSSIISYLKDISTLSYQRNELPHGNCTFSLRLIIRSEAGKWQVSCGQSKRISSVTAM